MDHDWKSGSKITLDLPWQPARAGRQEERESKGEGASGLPSFSSGSGKPTPTFGSSISGSMQASSGGSDQRQQSTKDTMTSTIMEGQRSQQRSTEADEGGEGDDEATLEKPYVKVTTVVEIGGDKKTVEKGHKKTVQSSVLEIEEEHEDEGRPMGSGAASSILQGWR